MLELIIPIFSIVGKEEIIDNADVVLIEGILVFYDPEIRKLFDMRIFVDTDSDIRLARRGIYLHTTNQNTYL